MKNFYPLVLFSLIFCSIALGFNADYVVSKNGTGDFTSIQDAINAIPSDNHNQFIIYIKNGLYSEKLFIERNNIVLVGEDKDSTRIVYAELRENWRNNHPDDYGAAVVNIKNNVSNLILKNLTVYNDFGRLYGNTGHQFAIRGSMGVTKIIIDNCNIIADGGDTLSLWNTDDGMYYHRKCYFEGYVDYVCPRGYCFVDDCKFFGHNLSASIWHDGNANKDQKFVIKNSFFDGVSNFPLGRFHKDSQFYLLDCTFSKNMADTNIYFSKSNPPRELKWGKRVYYYNCNSLGNNFQWFANNLNEAEGKPEPKDITVQWTFNNKWDPVEELNSLDKKLNSNNNKKL